MSAPGTRALTGALTVLLALAAGVVVANLYYAQPLLAPISTALGIAPALAGFALTVTQIGYGLGLLLIVPLGDRFENRRLIVTCLLVLAVALLGAGTAPNAAVFLFCALACGLSACAAQMLIPFASRLAGPAERGKVVGNITAGLLLGIMLARPLSSLMAAGFGWRSIFLLSAGLVALLALAMARLVPAHRPLEPFRYRALFGSLAGLLRRHAVLRRRAAIQFFLFGAFTVFWTTVPLLLASPAYGMSQVGIAAFALLGVTGAAVAPFVGRAADRGQGARATTFALIAAAASFALCAIGGAGTMLALALLVVAGVLLDCGAASALVVGQRTVLTLGEEARSRLNGLFFSIFYMGGAVGSALGAYAYVAGGWIASSALGFAMTCAALALHLTDRTGTGR